MKKHILILCTANSARSQMAEGILRHLAGDRLQVSSAGTRASLVRPEAIAACAEIGIDLSTHRSKSVDEFLDQPIDTIKIDTVITVCDHAKEVCPVFPHGPRMLHWSFPDPEPTLDSFRSIRDQIRSHFAAHLGELM
jgi:arsenate reductase (thioredoxin)